MAKKKTVVEEVKLQDAPVLRDSPEPEVEAESDPAPERKPWVDFIPPYVKDNAKGYPRYVDKLAEALNGVVEGGGGGGGSSDEMLFVIKDYVTPEYDSSDIIRNHRLESETSINDVISAITGGKKVFVQIEQIFEITDGDTTVNLPTYTSIPARLLFDENNGFMPVIFKFIGSVPTYQMGEAVAVEGIGALSLSDSLGESEIYDAYTWSSDELYKTAATNNFCDLEIIGNKVYATFNNVEYSDKPSGNLWLKNALPHGFINYVGGTNGMLEIGSSSFAILKIDARGYATFQTAGYTIQSTDVISGTVWWEVPIFND